MRDVCRFEGFAVEMNVESEKNTGRFVDIVASRKQGKKVQKVAFECWERDVPADAREIEGFAKRLRDISCQNGIYVSPKGFTNRGEYVARSLGVELWDLPKLKEHLSRIQPSDRTKVPGTLPVSKNLSGNIFSRQLENARFLKMRSLPRLEFRPYYFAMFDTNAGRKDKGRGVLVLDGVDGRVCDGAMLEGQLSRLPSTGFFIDCLHVEPMTGHLPKLSQELGVSSTVTVAPAGILQEQVRGLVGGVLEKETGLDSGSVTVTGVELLHVPIVTVELGAAEKTYRKIVQAATGKMIWDETAQCVYCKSSSVAVCEVCGGTCCSDHVRACSSCGRRLCGECVMVKGVLNKKPLCPTCRRA